MLFPRCFKLTVAMLMTVSLAQSVFFSTSLRGEHHTESGITTTMTTRITNSFNNHKLRVGGGPDDDDPEKKKNSNLQISLKIDKQQNDNEKDNFVDKEDVVSTAETWMFMQGTRTNQILNEANENNYDADIYDSTTFANNSPRRALKLRLADSTCTKACDSSTGKIFPHLKECFGEHRTTTCCLCMQQGFVPAVQNTDLNLTNTADSVLNSQIGEVPQNVQNLKAELVNAKVELAMLRQKLAQAEKKVGRAQPFVDSKNDAAETDIDVDSYQVTCQAPHPSQIFYNRIGKAGSSSVMYSLKGSAARNGYSVKEGITSEYLTSEGALEVLQKYVGWGLGCVTGSCSKTIFIGHIFFMDLGNYLQEHQFTRPAYINWLRDPTERYISQYFFWHTLSDIGPSTSKVGKTLEECVSSNHQYGCPPLNYMTSYMCGTDTICNDPPDEQTYLRAKRNLVTKYAMVGLTESMDQSMKLLAKTFPSWFKSPPSSTGTANKNSRGKKPVSSTLKAKVEQANSYDRRLYDVAKQLFQKRLTACAI